MFNIFASETDTISPEMQQWKGKYFEALVKFNIYMGCEKKSKEDEKRGGKQFRWKAYAIFTDNWK